MPSYLDFNSTKEFRDFILNKTLQVDGGPQEYTEDNYIVHHTNSFSNQDLPEVDATRVQDLSVPQTKNVYKPDEYPIFEELEVLQRRANLRIYPYFEYTDNTLIGIMANNGSESESELMKFAKEYIKSDEGPVYARIQQNLEAATIGRVRLIDALNGSVSTATNIVTGREPLIESNYKISVAKTLPRKGIDFLQTVAGLEFPWSEIPGDYLSDPKNPVNYRPEAQTEIGRFIQDGTGAIGSLFGIQRRPTTTRKPSDLMIEYMGQGQKNLLFDMLSYSTYAPNYTTRARSQNTSKIFNFIDTVAQGVKNVLGMEAPDTLAYIGDDRGEDVKYTMSDFYGNIVKSPFYLSLMFDEVQANLFHRERNVSEYGPVPGNLTWISTNSRNQLGANNSSWGEDQSEFLTSQSTNYQFRYGSILEKTQEILDSMPNNGLEARSHVANVIDQTSRFFKDGDKLISRGSNVRYVNSRGIESGVELSRVWTKDRPYMKYSDTMRRTDTVRKYDDSVLSRPWNLNIAPMSDGKNNFNGTSTNIFKSELDEGFYAKKYMFSLENLAWKASNTPGFTYGDLPYCERGPNGGRIMWFPPYDLKITEQSDAKWESTAFLGRPEPIYTYQNTERAAQVTFKVIVDHPSILNLLVSEEFKNMSDEESENAINSFFAGSEDLDFYDLINRYKTITPKDATTIVDFLNKGTEQNEILNYSIDYEKPLEYEEDLNLGETVTIPNLVLYYEYGIPNETAGQPLKNNFTYSNLYNGFDNIKPIIRSGLSDEIDRLIASNKAVDLEDLNTLFGVVGVDTDARDTKLTSLDTLFTQSDIDYNLFYGTLETIRTLLGTKEVEDVEIFILTNAATDRIEGQDEYLAFRRSSAIFKEIIERLRNSSSIVPKDLSGTKAEDVQKLDIEIKFSDLGYESEGSVKVTMRNDGEDITTVKGMFNSVILKSHTPEMYAKNNSSVTFVYKLKKQEPEQEPDPEEQAKNRTNIVVSPGEDKNNYRQPPIDEMKKIISKTLSECYYFKKLEEEDPVVFGTLREKIKYFHPAFHSMTPEGLNARLTFIQQCVRPGETIPIKGVNEDLDLRARNTSFGAPPVCVLRIGDFFNTKVVISNVNIEYDDSLWDLNPEGIGVQPMIATVTLQVNIIGGSGIKEPVNRLQNALSSNFYANTEMYDERAINTADTIAGKDREQFTKEFLEAINSPTNTSADSNNFNKGNKIKEGVYIGERSGDVLSYKQIVRDVFSATENYFDTYVSGYNNIMSTYGDKIGAMLLHPYYRPITAYTITNVVSSDIELFGEYPKGKDLTRLTENFKTNLLSKLDSSNITTIIGLDKDLTVKTKAFAEELLKSTLNDFIIDTIDDIKNNKDVKEIEDARNQLISALDKPNFINKYGYDISVKGETATKVTVSPFQYENYSSNVFHVVKNASKLYEDLDTTYNFFSSGMSDDYFIEFLSIFLYNNTNVIMDVIKANTLKFTDRDIDKIGKRLGKFTTKPGDTKKFRFTVFKSFKNDDELSITIIEEVDVTDQAVIDEAKMLFSSKVDITNNKLNYYKK